MHARTQARTDARTYGITHARVEKLVVQANVRAEKLMVQGLNFEITLIWWKTPAKPP